MARVTIRSIVQTSIVTAFTIAAALIWTDVISDFINTLVPPREALFYEFIAAIIATVFVVIAIFVILKTEAKAESIVKRFKNRK